MEYLGAWGTLIHEKNLKSKISCQTPFNSTAQPGPLLNTTPQRWGWYLSPYMSIFSEASTALNYTIAGFYFIPQWLTKVYLLLKAKEEQILV